MGFQTGLRYSMVKFESQIVDKMLFYAAIFLLGLLLVALWSAWITVRPTRIRIPLTPQHYHLPAEEVTIRTSDGLDLSAWFIPREDRAVDAPVVILLHGYPAEKGDMLGIAQALHPYLATLVMDLRYFGKSQGRFTTLGLRERDDLSRAVDYLEGRGLRRIGVFGFSMGGAVGMMAAADDSRIRAVATYGSYSDLITLGREAYRNLWILKYPLVEMMRWWAEAILGDDPTAISPLGAAGTFGVPALITHSRADEQIPFHHAEALRRALGTNPRAEFYFFDQGRHGDLPADYEERLIYFFLRSI